MDSLAHLGHIELLDPRGRPVAFQDVWSRRTTVLGFLRHFGCLFCHEQASELLDIAPELREVGANLVLVGNGNPAHAGEFMRRIGLEDSVYTDPGRLLYRRLGLAEGVLRTVGPASRINALRASRNGYRQLGVRGARWQQGATLLVSPTGEILYQHRAQVAGEHAPAAELLKAVHSSVRSKG